MSVLEDAQHEAAHVVVGVALGLRFDRANLDEAVWYARPWPREAGLIMYAAGVAWERQCGDLERAAYDLADLRRAGVRGNARIRVLERAAWALLAERSGVHARITRALLDGPVTGRDIRAMIRGPM